MVNVGISSGRRDVKVQQEKLCCNRLLEAVHIQMMRMFEGLKVPEGVRKIKGGPPLLKYNGPGPFKRCHLSTSTIVVKSEVPTCITRRNESLRKVWRFNLAPLNQTQSTIRSFSSLSKRVCSIVMHGPPITWRTTSPIPMPIVLLPNVWSKPRRHTGIKLPI